MNTIFDLKCSLCHLFTLVMFYALFYITHRVLNTSCLVVMANSCYICWHFMNFSVFSDEEGVVIENATFSWSKDSGPCLKRYASDDVISITNMYTYIKIWIKHYINHFHCLNLFSSSVCVFTGLTSEFPVALWLQSWVMLVVGSPLSCLLCLGTQKREVVLSLLRYEYKSHESWP